MTFEEYRCGLTNCYAVGITDDEYGSPKPEQIIDNIREIVNLSDGKFYLESDEKAEQFCKLMRSLFPDKEMVLPDSGGFWNRDDQFHFSESRFGFYLPEVTAERMYDYIVANEIVRLDGHGAGSPYIDEDSGKIQLFACNVLDPKNSYYGWDSNNVYSNYTVDMNSRSLQLMLDYPQLFEPIIHCDYCCGCGDW